MNRKRIEKKPNPSPTQGEKDVQKESTEREEQIPLKHPQGESGENNEQTSREHPHGIDTSVDVESKNTDTIK
ncbi:MAG: hypothetical protein ABI763_08230 [Bacteroidota bacterium]